MPHGEKGDQITPSMQINSDTSIEDVIDSNINCVFVAPTSDHGPLQKTPRPQEGYRARHCLGPPGYQEVQYLQSVEV